MTPPAPGHHWVVTRDDDPTGWMTSRDAELFRILSRGAPEEERRQDAERITAEERKNLRRLAGAPEKDAQAT